MTTVLTRHLARLYGIDMALCLPCFRRRSWQHPIDGSIKENTVSAETNQKNRAQNTKAPLAHRATTIAPPVPIDSFLLKNKRFEFLFLNKNLISLAKQEKYAFDWTN